MVEFPSGQEKAQPISPPPSPSPLGVYIHVPFCATTCDFCAFYQTVPKGDAVRRYLDGVELEAGLVPWQGRRISTAFWGGGTPGLLRPAEIEQLGRTMLRGGEAPAEWSVELAPATVTEDRLAVLQALGVTRISLGVQSFRPDLLDALGRQHTPAQIYRAYDLIRARGFASVNLDLMFALPGQTETQWRADLAEALRLAPNLALANRVAGQLALASGQSEAAFKFLRRAVDLEAYSAESLYALGRAQLSTRELQSAGRATLARAHRLDANGRFGRLAARALGQ